MTAPARARIPKRLVPLAQGAAYRQVGKSTIRSWIAAGLITGYRVGPKLMYVDLDQIDAITHASR